MFRGPPLEQQPMNESAHPMESANPSPEVLLPDDSIDGLRKSRRRGRIPIALKLAYTAFLSVLVPLYWMNYGPTNFLYFCDVALLLTLVGMWSENRLLVSMPAVGILVPQALWVVDFVGHGLGFHLTGMTDYMFDGDRSLFLRGLSLFHGWLPFLLVYLVARLGYDRRAFRCWTALAWALCLVCFAFMPPAGAVMADPRLPVNINYVWGLSDTKPQDWMSPGLYLLAWMVALVTLAYAPVHHLLRRWDPIRA